MRRKIKLIRGLGLNDADYEVVRHEEVGGARRISWVCPIYRAWRNMLNRCYSSNFPTYDKCVVTDDWLLFSVFHAWMNDKDYLGMDLDKDLLIAGNRVYGPSACVFISHDLNSFLVDRASKRGIYPLGVTMHAQTGKYRAKCRNPFTNKTEHLGLFFSPEKAHEAWGARKHHLACIYADQQVDHRVASALRLRFAKYKESSRGNASS